MSEPRKGFGRPSRRARSAKHGHKVRQSRRADFFIEIGRRQAVCKHEWVHKESTRHCPRCGKVELETE